MADTRRLCSVLACCLLLLANRRQALSPSTPPAAPPEPESLCQSRVCSLGFGPRALLRAYVGRFTGPDPKDCGVYLSDEAGFPTWRTEPWPSPSELAMIKAQLQCVEDSTRTRTPFWTAGGGMSTDSYSASGVLGQADGSLYFFHFDGKDFKTTQCLKMKSDRLECEAWAVPRK